MLFFTILILLVLMVFSWYRYHDLICPSFLFGVFWIISLLGVPLLGIIDDISPFTAFVLVCGAVVFVMGFNFAYAESTDSSDTIYGFNNNLKILTAILSVVFCYVVYDFLTMSSIESLYARLRDNTDENFTLGSYFKKIIECISLCVLVVYWRIQDKEEKRRIRKYVFLVGIMGALCAFSIASRNGMLQFFFPLLVIFIVTHNITVKKQIAILLVGGALFMGYYYYISLNKYSYLYEKSNSATETLKKEVGEYLSGSIVGFDLASSTNTNTRNGKNTFRFFYALSDRINKSKDAEKLTNEFFTKGRLHTNVYTFYDFYQRDFGYFYAIFMQLIVGCLHGVFYRKRGSAIGLYFLAMLSYPLIMQFFQDQYFSLTSTWLQIIIIALLVFKTNFIIKKDVKTD